MEPVQIGNILISPDRIAELEESRIVASISRTDFRGGAINVARVCKRPYLLTLLALGMIGLGGLTARGVMDWLSNGGTIYDVSLLMLLLIPSGCWLLYQAWRRAPMILIETEKGTVRLEFKGPRTAEAVADLQRATQEHGYTLRREGERR
jgi:hypothetical protein